MPKYSVKKPFTILVAVILVLVLGMVFATSAVRNSLMNYIGYFAVIAAIMLAALVVFMLTVRENEWAAEMQQQSVELGLEDKEEAATGERKLSVDEVKSLIPSSCSMISVRKSFRTCWKKQGKIPCFR